MGMANGRARAERPRTARHKPNSDALARAYAEHASDVYGVAYRLLRNTSQAQDVTQDVFLRFWCEPERFDPRRGPLGGYLCTLARNRALDLARRTQTAGRARDRIRLHAGRDEGRVEDRPVEATERHGEETVIRGALSRLPRSQREAIVMAYWGGLTAEQIAARSRVPTGTVKSRIRLGLRKLRKECARELDGPPQIAA